MKILLKTCKMQRGTITGISFNLVVLFMIGLMISSCSSGKSSVLPEEANGHHNIRVVPYKASPIKVDVFKPIFVGGIAGAISTAIHRGPTEDIRGKIADKLNVVRGDWDPSLATAVD